MSLPRWQSRLISDGLCCLTKFEWLVVRIMLGEFVWVILYFFGECNLLFFFLLPLPWELTRFFLLDLLPLLFCRVFLAPLLSSIFLGSKKLLTVAYYLNLTVLSFDVTSELSAEDFRNEVLNWFWKFFLTTDVWLVLPLSSSSSSSSRGVMT